MIVIADTSGILAASDRNARERSECKDTLDSAGTVVVSPLVLAEVDHLAKARLGSAARSQIIDSILVQCRRERFQIPHADGGILERARAVQRLYAALDLDLADAVNVTLAARYHTVDVLTLDHRDYRAVKPLTHHSAFRLLPFDRQS